jgi:hypothetical protein
MEEVSKLFRLHKYVWGISSEDLEALEQSEKLRVKLITGQYSDWKSTSSYDGSLTLKYKMRVGGIVLSKRYNFKDNKLYIEHYSVLQEGLVPGNPDMDTHDLPLDLAYKVYSKLDSMMRLESTPPNALCIGSGYDCIHSPYADSAVYGSFFDSSQLPLDLSSMAKFQATLSRMLAEAREKNIILPDERFQIIQRRSTLGRDGYFELNIATNNAREYDVWLIARKKLN